MRSVHVTDEEEDEVKASVVTSKHITVEVLVPQHAVGAVIGLQGSQIKQVSTHCELTVNKLLRVNRNQLLYLI